MLTCTFLCIHIYSMCLLFRTVFWGNPALTCMDLEPPTQSVARPRSSRSRHGSSSKATSRRPPSPDSACEHDAEWVGGAISGQEEMTSDLSEESSDNVRNSISKKSGPSMRRKSDSALIKG